MPTRSFHHPLHLHPVVGPLLVLTEAPPSDLVDADLEIELRIIRRLAASRFERFAEAHGLMPAGARLDLPGLRLPEALRGVPASLLARYRPSRKDGFASQATLRLAAQLATRGPEGLEAARLSRAGARLVRTGVWPSARPRFIARLDGTIPSHTYAPSPFLARALTARGRLSEALRVAHVLQGELRRSAEREIADAIVDDASSLRALPPRIERALLARRAVRAAVQGDERDAEALFGQLPNPRARHFAALRVAQHLLDHTGDLDQAEGWLRRAVHFTTGTARYEDLDDGDVSGRWLLVRSELSRRRGSPRDAWWSMRGAASTPKRSLTHWEAARPDAEISAQALVIALEGGGAPEGWPWGLAHARGLDDLDRMLDVVHRTRSRPEVGKKSWLHSKWLSGRLRQAEAAAALERLHWGNLGPQNKAAEAQAFVRGLFADQAFGASLPSDPHDPVRACFDDGLARSGHAKPHRRALVAAAKQALKGRPEVTPAAAEVRLATLQRIGGARAARTLQSHLRGSQEGAPLHGALLEALIDVEPRAMLGPMMLDARRYGNGKSDDDYRARLEQAGLLSDGFTAAAHALLLRLEAVIGPETEAWWSALCRAHWLELGAAPPPGLLDALCPGSQTAFTQDARAALREHLAAQVALGALDPEAWLKAVTTPEGLRVALAQSPRSRRDSPRTWTALLARLRSEPTGRPAPRVFEQLEAALPGRDGLFARLLAGRAPTPELDEARPVGTSNLRLRALHKTRDAFTFLRFGDSVTCCFNSRCSGYKLVEAELHIRKLWRDPMSFCLVVERVAPPHTARGFVFGGFGLIHDKTPALLLNGLYLSRPSTRARAATLEVLERDLARPLGVSWIGLGNRCGGRGRLPSTYAPQVRSVRRLRALMDGRGRLDREVYDDLGSTVNAPAPAALAWRRL